MFRQACNRRGIHQLQRFTLASLFPLGLVRPWAPLLIQARCLVYPRPKSAGPLPAPSVIGRSAGHQSGGLDDEFYGLRAYQPGDALRSIHWKSIAKGQEPMTRQFSSGGIAEELWLDGNQLHGGVEEILSYLTQWVIDAELTGARYGVRYSNLLVELGRGEQHRHKCLEALALFGTGHYE